jgi:Endonuclease-reverse transcriptase
MYLVYRPPNSKDMVGLTDIIRNAGPHSIFIGDFNLPDINWSSGTAGSRGQPFLEATEEKFMSQLVDFPTQVKGNTLGLIITNSQELIDEITPEGRLGKSDHEI